MNINTFTIIGNLTRDAELKYLQNGTALLKFTVAVNRRVKRGETWEDEASYFDCTQMGKAADSVAKYLTKGKQIGVSGYLKQDRWEKDGQKHSKIVLYAETIQLLGKTEGGGHVIKNDQPETTGSYEDDIPF
jgi:single-strand DNA-binding protein